MFEMALIVDVAVDILFARIYECGCETVVVSAK